MSEPWPGCITITGERNSAARQYYLSNGLRLFAWSSLAGGFFSGRFTRSNSASFSSEDDLTCMRAYCHEQNFRRLERAGELAAEKGVTVAQISLAYVVGQPWEVAVLTGCRSAEEVCDVCGGVEVTARERLRLEG